MYKIAAIALDAGGGDGFASPNVMGGSSSFTTENIEEGAHSHSGNEKWTLSSQGLDPEENKERGCNDCVDAFVW